jgi:hypothetical protein
MGHLLVFSTGSSVVGFFSMKVGKLKKSENNGNAGLSIRDTLPRRYE